MKENTKILLELITYFEEHEWEYSITWDFYLETYLGNQLYRVPKDDVEALKNLQNTIQNW